MGFESKSNKCKKLKVEKSSLTMSCIYKFAQSSICYIFCCKHIMQYLTIVKGTEPKLPFITKHSNVSENKQINLGVSKLFSYHSYIYLNKNLPKPYNVTRFSSSDAPKVWTHHFLYNQTVRSTPFSSASGCSALLIPAARRVRSPGRQHWQHPPQGAAERTRGAGSTAPCTQTPRSPRRRRFSNHCSLPNSVWTYSADTPAFYQETCGLFVTESRSCNWSQKASWPDARYWDQNWCINKKKERSREFRQNTLCTRNTPTSRQTGKKSLKKSLYYWGRRGRPLPDFTQFRI